MDWPVLPETPSSLASVVSGGSVRLRWKRTAAMYATPLLSDESGVDKPVVLRLP